MNAAFAAGSERVVTPLLYLRGDREPGNLHSYVLGLRDAAFDHVAGALIPGSGHVIPEEARQGVWGRISSFVAV
jgi:pimeloyl-ACP methyl ester carboxylesterase